MPPFLLPYINIKSNWNFYFMKLAELTLQSFGTSTPLLGITGLNSAVEMKGHPLCCVEIHC